MLNIIISSQSAGSMFEVMLVTKLVPVRVKPRHPLVAHARPVVYADRVSTGWASGAGTCNVELDRN